MLERSVAGAPLGALRSPPADYLVLIGEFGGDTGVHCLDTLEAGARYGLPDFRDAMRGPSEYGPLLLQDALRGLGDGLEDTVLSHSCGNPPKLRGAADENCIRSILGAQWHARIPGVFVRLCRADSTPCFRAFPPRVPGQFQAASGDTHPTDVRGSAERRASGLG